MSAASSSRPTSASPAGSGDVPARNPLEAIPGIAPGVEWDVDNLDMVQIRITPARQGWMGRLLGPPRKKIIKLDERGSFFFKSIGRRRTLGDIAAMLSKRFEVPEQEARLAVVAFTRTLMNRGLIFLEVKRS
jgi:hypothetical protein